MGPTKNTNFASQLVCLITSLSLITGCAGSNGFATGTTGSLSTSPGNGSLGGGGSSGDISQVEKMDYKAAIPSDNSLIDNRFGGMDFISFDHTTKEVVMTLPMYLEIDFQADMSVAFPQFPGIHFSMVSITDEDGYILGNALEIRVPISALLKGLNFVPGRLPNGQSLRGFPQNEAPTTNVSFNIKGNKNMKLYVYLGVNNIGFFIEGDWGGNFINQIPLSIFVPIKNETKTAIRGYFGFVAKGLSSRPGFYLSYRLPAEVAAFLEKNLGIQ